VIILMYQTVHCILLQFDSCYRILGLLAISFPLKQMARSHTFELRIIVDGSVTVTSTLMMKYGGQDPRVSN
ncbi:hypothetical protein BLOT_003155, partial [Blomia tropicalis]